MPIYEKPVWNLLIDFADEVLVGGESTFSPSDAYEWFQQKYPAIKKGTINAHVLFMSTNVQSRLNWKPSRHHNVFFSLGSGLYRRYDAKHDPPPIMQTNQPKLDDSMADNDDFLISTQLDGQDHGNEFAFEKDLQNFLVKNLELIEPGLRLYEEEGITGVEFPVGGRRVDILAVDTNNHLVVIELKVSRGHDRVLGQILRYMGWIKENLADENQNVRGIIIARDITSDLKWACAATQGITLKEYSISFSLDKIN